MKVLQCWKFVWVLVLFLALTPGASASDSATDAPFFASFATLPCDALSAGATTEPAVELDFEVIEELPLTPAVSEEKAVTCGSWIYNGCCISQTKYRRRCQFNQAEWWYEYKCQGVCVM